jgi:predicted nucleotidyltransferase
MEAAPLGERELELVRGVLRRHPEILSATLYGSRAKGTHSHYSDIDLTLQGDVDPLQAEAIAAELEELPTPYRFDVQASKAIRHPDLIEHIRRVGVQIYPEVSKCGNSLPAG